VLQHEERQIILIRDDKEKSLMDIFPYSSNKVIKDKCLC